jgi:hypothetical protein
LDDRPWHVIRRMTGRSGPALKNPNHSSIFGCQFAAIPINFARPIRSTITESAFAIRIFEGERWDWTERARATPERIHDRAVAGFIATKPGTMRFNSSTSRYQPASTSMPTPITRTLAAAGKALKRTGTLEPLSVDRCVPNTNYTCDKKSRFVASCKRVLNAVVSRRVQRAVVKKFQSPLTWAVR